MAKGKKNKEEGLDIDFGMGKIGFGKIAVARV